MRLHVVYDERGGVIAATTLLDPEQLKADPFLVQAVSVPPPLDRKVIMAELTVPEQMSDLSLAEICEGHITEIGRLRFGGA